MSRTPRRLLAAALGLGVALCAGPTALASPAAPTSPAGTAPGGWSVAGAPGGYRVTLRLARPLPVRDALPGLAVDGTPLGPATQSPDGRSLSVVTADARVLRADRVALTWDGAVPTAREPAVDATAQVQPAGPLVDPAAAGPYAVVRADYDRGDTALRLPGLRGHAVEERAAVFVPSGAPGRRPVVLFLHGRHEPCYGDGDTGAWPCAGGSRPVPSYLGYDGSAQVLASRGYVVVSISADGINALDGAYADDGGALARGQLVLDHLDLLAAADRGAAPGLSRLLTGRLDLQQVGLMGHSRGGEGVVKAALLNAARPAPYGIRAVLPLAPVDFLRQALPDVPMAVVLPYCDGDVWDQQGQHFYDDSRYADAQDRVLRTSLLVMGADHNFFNSEWTPGVATAPANDDWYDDGDPTCGASSPTRLTAGEQYAVGVAYISGFFRLELGHELALLPLFDGSGGRAASAGRAVVHTEAQSPGRLDVAPLRGPSARVRTAGHASAQYCAGVGAGSGPSSPLPTCAGPGARQRFPHWTPAAFAPDVPTTALLHLTWSAPGTGLLVDLPGGGRDVSAYDALTLRLSRDTTTTDADLQLSLVDGSGRVRSVRVADLGSALSVLPGSGPVLRKLWLETVRLPLARLAGLDLRDVRQVRLTPTTTGGGVYVSDVAFRSAAAGSGGPSALPRVSVQDTSVPEGDGPSTLPLTVTLSQPSAEPVRAWVQALPQSGGVALQAQEVLFAPGQRRATIRVPFRGDQRPGGSVRCPVYVSVTSGAVAGARPAYITLLDDDGP